MKLIGNLLLVICIITGSLAVSTAYLAPLNLDDDAYVQSTDQSGEKIYANLASPAGKATATEQELAEAQADFDAENITPEAYVARREAVSPILDSNLGDAGTALTPQRREALQADNIKYVQLKQFKFERWPHKWHFILSCLGLLVGSVLIRQATKKDLAAALTGEGTKGAQESPAESIAAVQNIVDALRADLPGMPADKDRLRAITSRIETAQKIHIASFIDSRPMLIARLGLGGYAELMDRFAAAERQINRAWSAAADEALYEATDSLDRASELFKHTTPKLPN